MAVQRCQNFGFRVDGPIMEAWVLLALTLICHIWAELHKGDDSMLARLPSHAEGQFCECNCNLRTWPPVMKVVDTSKIGVAFSPLDTTLIQMQQMNCCQAAASTRTSVLHRRAQIPASKPAPVAVPVLTPPVTGRA